MKQGGGGNNNIMMSKKQLSSVFMKFGVCFLLVGLAYRLLDSSFVQLVPVVDTVFSYNTSSYSDSDTQFPPPPIDSSLPLHVENNQTSQDAAECDVFRGDWIPDPAGPVYTNSSCKSIEGHQNCMRNGRPDTEYFYWRWKPRDCELPRFDAMNFLNFMRNKSMAFIGDSIMRNHVQSLLCTLSQVEEGNEVYHDKEFHSKRWYFPTYSFSLVVVWSPFLAKATIHEDDNGVSSGAIQLHVDEPDTVWTEQYKDFDYVLIAGGKWYLKTAIYYENNSVVGCHGCADKNITDVGFVYAYQKALHSVLSYMTRAKQNVYAFLRTTTPDHFEHGEWNTGRYCNRTEPFKHGEVNITGLDQLMHKVELEEFERASAQASGQGLKLKLFDTTFLSFLRPDGHPGVYRQYHPYDGIETGAKIQNDCLHWCLPGPIDSWNDLIWQQLHTG